MEKEYATFPLVHILKDIQYNVVRKIFFSVLIFKIYDIEVYKNTNNRRRIQFSRCNQKYAIICKLWSVGFNYFRCDAPL